MLANETEPSRWQKWKQKLAHGFRDWLALNIVGVPIGLITFSLEVKLFHLSAWEVGRIRILYIPLLNLVIFKGFWGNVMDEAMKKIPFWEHPLFQRFLAGGIAASVVRIPLYAGCALLAGIEPKRVLGMCLYNVAGNFATGWLNSLLRDKLRKRFKFFNGKA